MRTTSAHRMSSRWLAVVGAMVVLLVSQLPLNRAQNIIAPSATPKVAIEVIAPIDYAGKRIDSINVLTGKSLILECQVYNKPIDAKVLGSYIHFSVQFFSLHCTIDFLHLISNYYFIFY